MSIAHELAESGEARRKRRRELLGAALVATPVAVALCLWAIPALVRAILGGATELDAGLRDDEAFMREACAGELAGPEHERLCGCVFSSDHPGLDCQSQLNAHLLRVHALGCADPAARKAALSFCTCVDTVAAAVADADDEEQARKLANHYRRCTPLPDAPARRASASEALTP